MSYIREREPGGSQGNEDNSNWPYPPLDAEGDPVDSDTTDLPGPGE